MDSAVKTYSEVRAEASLLRELVHPHLIGFLGLCLKPMCIALEWAPKKSLKSILNNYKKCRAQLSPRALQETARQVRCTALFCEVFQFGTDSHTNPYTVFSYIHMYVQCSLLTYACTVFSRVRMYSVLTCTHVQCSHACTMSPS